MDPNLMLMLDIDIIAGKKHIGSCPTLVNLWKMIRRRRHEPFDGFQIDYLVGGESSFYI